MKAEGYKQRDLDDLGQFNPFDPQKLRIGQRFGESQDVRRVLVTVPIQRPHRQAFVRTHPDAEMWIEVALLEVREDRQTFLISPELAPYLPGEAVAKVLIPTITIHGHVFLWPIRLPDEQGRLDEWNETAFRAAELAKSKWVRLTANMGAGTYDVLEARGQFADPVWPDLTLESFLELGFKGRVITNLDHPVLKRLRGEH